MYTIDGNSDICPHIESLSFSSFQSRKGNEKDDGKNWNEKNKYWGMTSKQIEFMERKWYF